MAIAGAGATVLVSTHQLNTAERLCRRVAIVNHGRNIATGDLAALRTAAHTGEEGSLEDVFLRLTQEAAAPAVESPRRRGRLPRGKGRDPTPPPFTYEPPFLFRPSPRGRVRAPGFFGPSLT